MHTFDWLNCEGWLTLFTMTHLFLTFPDKFFPDFSWPVVTCRNLFWLVLSLKKLWRPISLSVCSIRLSGRPIGLSGRPIGLSGGNENTAFIVELKFSVDIIIVLCLSRDRLAHCHFYVKHGCCIYLRGRSYIAWYTLGGRGSNKTKNAQILKLPP